MKHPFVLAFALLVGTAAKANSPADSVALPLLNAPEGVNPELTSAAFSPRSTSGTLPASLSSTTPSASTSSTAEFKPSIKVGGYLVGKATVTDREDATSKSAVGLRMIRLYATGYVYPKVFYMLQGQLHNAPGEDRGPSIVDAFVEWQPLREVNFRLGQYSLPFGFENEHSIFDLNFSAITSGLTKLISLQDRVGQHAAGGRDYGVTMLGQLLPQADRHALIGYRVGLFSGQGMNHADLNSHKDLLGGFWISPIKPLRIGLYGWDGRYVNEKFDANNPLHQREVKRQRWLVGAEYNDGRNWARAEYISSSGGVVTNKNAATKSDAWYVEAGQPLCPKLRLNLRWDGYRDNKQWNSLVQNYQVAFNYYFNRNLYAQLEYYHTADRLAQAAGRDGHYNTYGLHVYCRF